MSQPLDIEIKKNDSLGLEVVLATGTTFKYAVIMSVNPASECYKHNIEMGDVILTIDDQPVFNYNHLENIAQIPSGQMIKLSILKQGAFKEPGLMSRCFSDIYGIIQKEMEKCKELMEMLEKEEPKNAKEQKPEITPNIKIMQKKVSEEILHYIEQNNLDNPKTKVSGIISNIPGSSSSNPKIIYHESKPSVLSNLNKSININVLPRSTKDKGSPNEVELKFDKHVIPQPQQQLIKREAKPKRPDNAPKITCHRHYQTLENKNENRGTKTNNNSYRIRDNNIAERPPRPKQRSPYKDTQLMNQPLYKAKSLNRLNEIASTTSSVSSMSPTSSLSSITDQNDRKPSGSEKTNIPNKLPRQQKVDAPQIPPRVKLRKPSNRAFDDSNNVKELRKVDKRKSRSVDKLMEEAQMDSMF